MTAVDPRTPTRAEPGQDDPAVDPAGLDILDDATEAPPRRSSSRVLPTRMRDRLALLTALLLLLGATAGLLTAVILPSQYAARAELLYPLTEEQPTGFLREDRNLTTQLVLFESRTVLAPVADRFDVSIEDLSEALEAEVVEGSEVIQVQLTDTDSARAERMLDAVVTEYLENSTGTDQERLREYLDGQLRELLDRAQQLRSGGAQGQAALDALAQDTVEAADRYLGNGDGDQDELRTFLATRLGEVLALMQSANAGTAVNGEQSELAALVEREQWLRTQLDELHLSELTGSGTRILVAPYVAADPVSPKPLITTAAGALTGLLLAGLAVAVVAHRTTRP